MEELIPVNIVIADRTYRLKIEVSDEEMVRKTAGLINDKITEFKTKVPGNYTLVDHALARAERGLLGVALHPDFANNSLVYLSYAEKGEGDTRGAALAQARGIQLALLMTVPSVAGAIAIPDLIMRALFARGAFTAAEVMLTTRP